MLERYTHSTSIKFCPVKCSIDSYIPCGIDIGYSAIKCKSIYNEVILPSIVYKLEGEDNPLYTDDLDIRYKDADGNVWFVGDLAKRTLRTKTKVDTDALLDRNRVYSESFIVQIRVAMFLCMLRGLDNKNYDVDNRQLAIETGLPSNYIKADSYYLREKFQQEHVFSIKIGKRPWKNVRITIHPENLTLCMQPYGTLMSCVKNEQGITVNGNLIKQTALIVDPGFHTADTLLYVKGTTTGKVLTEELGMQEILERTCKDIAKKTHYQAELSVYDLERHLLDGFIYYGHKKEKYDFTMDFQRNLREVCMEFIETLNIAYDHMAEVDVIILTGGTGKAWEQYFREEYGDLGGTELIVANKKDDDESSNDIVLANVQGYFNLIMAILKRNQHKKAGEG